MKKVLSISTIPCEITPGPSVKVLLGVAVISGVMVWSPFAAQRQSAEQNFGPAVLADFSNPAQAKSPSQIGLQEIMLVEADVSAAFQRFQSSRSKKGLAISAEKALRRDFREQDGIVPESVQKCVADSGVRVVTGEFESTLMVGNAIVRCGCGY